MYYCVLIRCHGNACIGRSIVTTVPSVYSCHVKYIFKKIWKIWTECRNPLTKINKGMYCKHVGNTQRSPQKEDTEIDFQFQLLIKEKEKIY
jgi:hypothetical protein